MEESMTLGKKHFVVTALAASLIAITLMNTQLVTAQKENSGAAPVRIVEPLPLPVRSAVEKTPVTVGFRTIAGNGFCQSTFDTCQVSYRVPEDKMLVIETIGVHAQAPLGQKIAATFNADAGFPLPLQAIGTFSGLAIGTGDRYESHQTTRLYALPGTFLAVTSVRSGASGGHVLDVAVSGYTIDCTTDCKVP
jgi:hypothetical protein